MFEFRICLLFDIYCILYEKKKTVHFLCIHVICVDVNYLNYYNRSLEIY
jgi:hypothetical protein